MKSPKEVALDRRLLHSLEGLLRRVAERLIGDPEVHVLQEYANAVSIVRLGYNDHGPVHMRLVTLNALRMAQILGEAGVPLSLEREGLATPEEARVAVLLAAFLHDIGMSVCRDAHEEHSAALALPILDRILAEAFPDALPLRIALRSVALEGIIGHMGHRTIHSLEAGLIPVADGCDMAKGRARIPMMRQETVRVGDIHRYSASAVDKVEILPGEQRPIRITVRMAQSVGLFQVEEVLWAKIQASPIQPYIELLAQVRDEKPRQYL